MKVLHLVGGDLSAGAARGAYWLHKALVGLGMDSRLFTNSKPIYSDPTIVYVLKSKIDKLRNLARIEIDSLPFIFYKNRKNTDFSLGFTGYDFTRSEEYKWADILHLHWINGGLVDIKHLSGVKKPVVWTMRDMWPMSGGCHYALDCTRYRVGCGKCPQLGSTRLHDITRWTVKRKRKYYPAEMTLVGISEWLSSTARESLIFRDFDVVTIHNNIDTGELFPINKRTARAILRLNTEKKIILYSANRLASPFKRFDIFADAVRKLDRRKYFFLFFGNVENDNVLRELGFEYKAFGFLYDFISLRVVYSACDVFVATSISEAFGKTIAEAMACGRPVVCFSATGPKEIVDHKKNGYLAKPFDPSDLARGIEWVLDPDNYQAVKKNARDKILDRFSSMVIAKQYLELYRRLT
ncbi:MAG: glycosyltransferase family 4 protein [Deltaproteobacteria bacterium]|nr:glycosyltransferase family 4 protein [Deltaproteobacteria bacterium]